MGLLNVFHRGDNNNIATDRRTSQDPVLPPPAATMTAPTTDYPHSNTNTSAQITPRVSTSAETENGYNYQQQQQQYVNNNSGSGHNPYAGTSNLKPVVPPGNSNAMNEKHTSPGDLEEGRGARNEELAAGIVTGRGTSTRNPDTTETSHGTTNTGRKHTIFGRIFDKVFKFPENDPFGPRPNLKTYIKMYWGDWFTLFVLGMIAFGLLKWSPLPSKKYFALAFNDSGELVNPEYSYPRQTQHLSIFADAAIAVLTPIGVSLIVNLFTVHSFWDLNNTLLGVVYSVMTACIIQIIVKLVAVGLRPYFLTACNPVLPPVKPGVGYQNLYFTIDICTEPNPKKIAVAMQSFPSGHSAAAWAGLFYLSLYLNGKLKPFANYHAAWWKMLAFLAPMVASMLIVGSLTLDNSHHWYDILAGSLLGVAMATLSYRMTYASVWDWRWNHIPLPRGNVMMYGGNIGGGMRGGHWEYKKREGAGLMYAMEEIDRWQGYVATSRGGWKPYSGAPVWRGAPGDMTASAAGVEGIREDHYGTRNRNHNNDDWARGGYGMYR